MSKKALGLLFSGRKNGNCSIMINEITKSIAEAGIEVEIISSGSLDIKHCIGCFGCNNSSFKCVLKDDLEGLKEKIDGADILILVSPCYIFGPPSILKSILDRSAAWALNRIENGEKQKIGISVSFAGGDGEWRSMQKATTSLFLQLYNCRVEVQKVYEKIALRGEVLLHPKILNEGRRIGEAAANQLLGVDDGLGIDDKDLLSCPVCKSDVFRIDGSIYTCAVCGQALHRGLLGILKEKNTIKLTPQGAAEHSEFIGSKIESGFELSNEISVRMEKYKQNSEIPKTPFVPVTLPEHKRLEWTQEALNEFNGAVPKGFQMFVKKAVERKAAEQGYTEITRDVFLRIKQASGN